MSRTGRAVACALPALIGQLLLAAPALADSGRSAPLQTAWHWYRPADAAPIAPPVNPGPSSDPTVPENGLPVMSNPKDGTSTKVSYVAFDLSAIPAGSTIDSFVVSAPTVSGSTQQSEPPKIIACLPTRTWTAGKALAWADRPVLDCETAKVAGAYDAATTTWTFDLTPLAGYWLLGNTGVGLQNEPGYTRPYQVVFDATKITAQVTWSPALVAAPQQPTPQVPAPEAAPPPLPDYSVGGGGLQPTGGDPAVPAAAPAPAPGPQVAPSGPMTQVATVAPLRVGSGSPTAGFWVLAVALAGLLVLASWVLGEAPKQQPVAATSSSRLDRALRARRQPARSQARAARPLNVRPV